MYHKPMLKWLGSIDSEIIRKGKAIGKTVSPETFWGIVTPQRAPLIDVAGRGDGDMITVFPPITRATRQRGSLMSKAISN